MYVWGSGSSSGAISRALLLLSVLASVSVMPIYRVLMGSTTTGNLLVAMLMHASLTASTLIGTAKASAGCKAVLTISHLQLCSNIPEVRHYAD